MITVKYSFSNYLTATNLSSDPITGKMGGW